MEAVNLSQVKQTSFTNKQEVQKEMSKTPEQKKNGAKLLALGAAAVGTIVIAGLIIRGKNKKVQDLASEAINNSQKKAHEFAENSQKQAQEVVNKGATSSQEEMQSVSNKALQNTNNKEVPEMHTNKATEVLETSRPDFSTSLAEAIKEGKIEDKNVEFFEEYYNAKQKELAGIEYLPDNLFSDSRLNEPEICNQYVVFEKLKCKNQQLADIADEFLNSKTIIGTPQTIQMDKISMLDSILTPQLTKELDEKVIQNLFEYSDEAGLKALIQNFKPEEINYLYKHFNALVTNIYSIYNNDDIAKFCDSIKKNGYLNDISQAPKLRVEEIANTIGKICAQ